MTCSFSVVFNLILSDNQNTYVYFLSKLTLWLIKTDRYNLEARVNVDYSIIKFYMMRSKFKLKFNIEMIFLIYFIYDD